MTRLRRSLTACTTEGLVAEVVGACSGGAVLTAWALYLGCSPLLIGLLAALPSLANLLQLPAILFTSAHRHRRVALVTVALSRQALLPLIALPFLPLSPQAKQSLLVAVAGTSAVLAVVGNNAWTAWIGDLVPEGVRGRYFGRRTALCALSSTAASVAAGALLDRLRGPAFHGSALALLALVACLAGALTTGLMSRQHDPPSHAPEAAEWSDAGRALLDRRTRPLLLFLLVWSLSTGLIALFDDVHMLRNLGLGFVWVAAQGATLAGMRVFGAPLWGKAVDRTGARPVLLVCAYGLSLTPLLWLLAAPDRLWPVVADAVGSGLLWSGFNLALFTLQLAVAPAGGRRLYLGGFSTVAGLSYAGAAALAGLLAGILPGRVELAGRTLFGLQALFVLSAGVRLGAALLAVRIVEEDSRPALELLVLARARLARAVRR